jgi:hypothetical protein
MTVQEEEQASRPLKDLPRQDLRQVLDRYRRALHLADEATLRDRCDWERPPLTFQTLEEDLPLTEIQSFRQVVSLLRIRARLEMVEGHPDRALRTLQVSMALARDVGNGPTLIDNLVGAAIRFTRSSAGRSTSAKGVAQPNRHERCTGDVRDRLTGHGSAGLVSAGTGVRIGPREQTGQDPSRRHHHETGVTDCSCRAADCGPVARANSSGPGPAAV